MKTAFAAILAIASVNAYDFANEAKFVEYVSEHGKSYGTVEEFEFRKSLFEKTEKFIQEHNQEGNSYTVGHNEFSDMTPEEYKKRLGYRRPIGTEGIKGEPELLDTSNLAASIDWVAKGAVTPIKNQGQCGSCWAFSSTGALEGAHFLKTGQLLSFSEQQLVDCNNKNYGCSGGWQYNAFQYWESYSAALESSYPYTGRNGRCYFDERRGSSVKVNNYAWVAPNNVSQLKMAVAKQPIAVLLQANSRLFQSYRGGVLDSYQCGTSLDHAVLLVGYGVENGKEFWKVKNSWGTTWGEYGYIKLAIRSGEGICGIQKHALYPQTN